MLKRFSIIRFLLVLCGITWGMGGSSLSLPFSSTLLTYAAEGRNVILIVADDLGNELGCYGNKAIKTPNLDRLASQGTLFSNAFCTTASCSPSRSVILTGLYSHANAQYGLQHAEHHFEGYANLKSLPLLLEQAGYRTAITGKLHVGPESAYRFGVKLPGNARNPVEMADNCREFLSARDKRPFFLYFCPVDPHRADKLASDDKPGVDSFGNLKEGYQGVETTQYKPEEVKVPSFLPDTLVSRQELAEYYQSVSRVDQGVGRLMQHLQESGREQETLVMFISDHGAPFPGGKTSLYDPGMRAPCIVRSPGKSLQGSVSRGMISWVDITPTILDFAGIDVNKPAATTNNPGKQKNTKSGKQSAATKPVFHGRSFLPLLEKESVPGWDAVYGSHTFHEVTMYYPMRVVRTERYKLIWNLAHELSFPFAQDLWRAGAWQEKLHQGPEALYGKRKVKDFLHRAKYELYDLQQDPDEVRNLAEDPAHAETLKDLLARIKSFQEQTDDPWLIKWEHE